MRASENSASRQSSRTHRDDGRQHGRHVRDDRGRGARDDGLHAADVVGDPRLDLAGARAREEGEREPLEVAVDLRAQVVHDLLAHHVGEPGLADAEHAGGDGDDDHPRHQQREQRVVVLGDRLVEHVPQQERGDDPQPRRDDDEREHRRQPPPVGAEQGGDAAASSRDGLGAGRARSGSSAMSSTSPMLMTGWNVICSRTSPGRRRGRRGCARAGSRRSGRPRGRRAPSASARRSAAPGPAA